MSYRTVDIFKINGAMCAEEALSGPEWKKLLKDAGGLDDFWDITAEHLLMIASASSMKPASA
jgi:hypothetical protein